MKIMAKKKIKKQFQVKISGCGTSYANATFDKFTGKFALEVCNSVLITMLKMMVGKENVSKSLYLMSLYYLKELHKDFDKKFPELKKDNFNDYLKTFEIIED